MKKYDPGGFQTQGPPFGSPTDYSLSCNSGGYNLEIWIYSTHALIYLLTTLITSKIHLGFRLRKES